MQSMVAIVARRTTIINHWYVSIDRPSQQRPSLSRAPSPRQSKSFTTESEAKQFASAMLSEGFKVMAGTLSPHQPKRRTITASEIDRWIEEKE
jgi:hypothetical protein